MEYLVDVYYHDDVFSFTAHNDASLELLRAMCDCNAEISIDVAELIERED